MGKIKIEEINSSIFKLAGKAYLRGKYVPEYNETSTNNKGLLTRNKKALVFLRPLVSGPDVRPPFKNPRPWTDFVDAKDKDYTDFDTFTKAFVSIISEIPTQ